MFWVQVSHRSLSRSRAIGIASAFVLSLKTHCEQTGRAENWELSHLHWKLCSFKFPSLPLVSTTEVLNTVGLSIDIICWVAWNACCKLSFQFCHTEQRSISLLLYLLYKEPRGTILNPFLMSAYSNFRQLRPSNPHFSIAACSMSTCVGNICSL